MAINTSRHLFFRKGGVSYALNMMRAADVTSAGYSARLGVYVDGSAWYIPAAAGPAAGGICFRKGGATYHCVNITPTLTFTFANDYDTNDYEQVIGWRKTLTKVSTSIALSTALDIYMSANAGSSWTKVATLSAGSLSVSPNYTMSNSTGGNFGVRAVTQVRYTRITGAVRWSGAENIGGIVTATVSLNSALPTGKIYVRGHWWGLVHTWGDSDVLKAGQSSGAAAREFITSGFTCSMDLRYDPQTTGASEQSIADIEWPSVGVWVVNRTDSLSFDAVASGGTAVTIAESKDVSTSATSLSAAVPQAYW